MLLQKFPALIVVVFLLTGQVFAQQRNVSQLNSTEISPALKNEAIALLREVIKDIPNLKAPENRRYFSVAAADLLWNYDEREARRMFQTATDEIRRQLAQTAAEIAEGKSKSERSPNSDVYAANNAYAGNVSADRNLKSRVGDILTMRSYLIYVLVENDPQMADDFFRGTLQFTGDPKFKTVSGEWDEPLQCYIARQWAKKDAEKAAEIATRLISKDFSYESLHILEEIYKQNAEQGNLLAEEFLQKLRASNPPRDKSFSRNYLALHLFKAAATALEQTKSNPGKKTLLAENSVRDLADYLGELQLRQPSYGFLLTSSEFAALIEKYAPEKAVRIREEDRRERENNVVNVAVVVNANRDLLPNIYSTSASNRNAAVQPPPRDRVKNDRDEMRKLEAEQKRLKADRESVSEKIKQKTSSAEDVAFVLEKIRNFSSKVRPREEEIRVFVDWVVISAEAGNMKMAEALMREAETLAAASETKTARDYMSKWWLATGYSLIAPGKSFAILENTVPPLNEVVSGFAKVSEFTDAGKNVFSNGEILVTGIAGSGYTIRHSQTFAWLPRSWFLTQNLVRADFTRAKNLTGKFERLEFRILARMLFLKALLKPYNETKR